MSIEPRGTEVTAPGDVRIRRALLSVSDKRALVDFARGLADLDVELVSTGGTARELAAEGIETRAIEDYTGFPEILDGRVKTLNPRIYAGLLAVRSERPHVDTLNEHEIEPIDLVCVNLYPFERVSSQRGVEDREVIENIDIGGPTLIRAAAKNHAYAAVVVSPESYDAVLEELRENGGKLSSRTRETLAGEAFSYTARYDTAISRWFAERDDDFPPQYTRSFEKVLDLPYGENPHQRAAYYAELGTRTHLLSMVSKLHGKELSFNNLLDLDAGRRLVEEFELPAAAIIKHNNPCGAAVGADVGHAFDRALATDRQSAFGGIFCFNRRVGRALAEKLHAMFVEVVFAPGYDDDALDVLQQKPNVRLLHDQERRRVPVGEHDAKRVRGHAGRDRTQADRGGVGRAAFRDAGVQARALERRRARPRARHGWDRGRSDEQSGLGPDRGRQGQSSRHRARRRRARIRRVLPLRGRTSGGDRGRRPGDHPAGRLPARSRGDRSMRRGGRRDGLHGPPPLPPLRPRCMQGPEAFRHSSNNR
jgi:phosphoribosylaminoimidazolecarboxamide formyltransferase/IMP cyclohydrolase